MHLRIDRDGVINRKSLNVTKRLSPEYGELTKLCLEDVGIPAGLRVFLTSGWLPRRQENGETNERDDNWAQNGSPHNSILHRCFKKDK